MIIEDQRKITCGGDPFNYLLSTLKGIALDINRGDTVNLLLMADKFPYDVEKFKQILNFVKLDFVDLKKNKGELSIVFKKR